MNNSTITNVLLGCILVFLVSGSLTVRLQQAAEQQPPAQAFPEASHAPGDFLVFPSANSTALYAEDLPKPVADEAAEPAAVEESKTEEVPDKPEDLEPLPDIQFNLAPTPLSDYLDKEVQKPGVIVLPLPGDAAEDPFALPNDLTVVADEEAETPRSVPGDHTEVRYWFSKLPPRCVIILRKRYDNSLIQKLQCPLACHGWVTLAVDVDAFPEIEEYSKMSAPGVLCVADGEIVAGLGSKASVWDCAKVFDGLSAVPDEAPQAEEPAVILEQPEVKSDVQAVPEAGTEEIKNQVPTEEVPASPVGAWTLPHLQKKLMEFSKTSFQSAEVRGMTFAYHLIQHHHWPADLVNRLTPKEQWLLHSADHCGKMQPGYPGDKVMYLSAPWCTFCKRTTPIVEKLQAEGFDIQKINVDDSYVDEEFEISSIPAVIILQDGLVTKVLTGEQITESSLTSALTITPSN